jgi:hypothetical protein
MKFKKVKLKLEPSELPPGFAYPAKFIEFAHAFPEMEDAFEPWGLTADADSNNRYSEQFGQPLVKFAQAWHEDMLACFVVSSVGEPAVVVINPWAQEVVASKTEQVGAVIEKFPSFDAWLEWMRNSDLVQQYAEQRGESEDGDSSPLDRSH